MSGLNFNNNVIRYKGKNIKKKVYERKMKQSETCKKMNELRSVQKEQEIEVEKNVEGRRIVDISVMANSLRCLACQEILSLSCIENETRRGLASFFKIRCHHCMTIRVVPTSNYSCSSSDLRQRVYDVNSRAILGSLHAGMGATHMNKLFSSMNIPAIDDKLFKRHERLIGPTVEFIAKSSCMDAVLEEKAATVENADEICKVLPDNFGKEFLILNPNEHEGCEVNLDEEACEKSQVRLMASYDMGWSKRGTGRNYDSLNGFGALIGSQTGKILDFGTRNRTCRLCDLGHDKSDHDCRQNFAGSAKAMEGNLASELANNSDILKSCNTDIGILIGDEDSCTIAAVRQGSSHQVVKLSDVNHISKGLSKHLYALKTSHKELTNDAIQWIKNCFTYALKQNVGNSTKIASTLMQIPLHAFNDHSTCGDWCKFLKDKENYDHSRVPGGLKSAKLLEELKLLFSNLSKNCAKFSHGSSSQANESLNSSMASRAPKMRNYSQSESADFRFAATVAAKNIGPNYIQNVTTQMSLSPVSKHTTQYLSRINRKATQRSTKSRCQVFKNRRNTLKKKRTNLRNKKESKEGSTYKSNMGLMINDVAVDTVNDVVDIEQIDENMNYVFDWELVYFDLETGSLALDTDILQIGLRFGEDCIGIYITPTKPISSSASKVNNLTFVEGELFLYGQPVMSVPLEKGLQQALDFLSKINKQCILVAHNANFDSARLIYSLRKTYLFSNFSTKVMGFVDTLPLFHQLLHRKNNCKLTFLAEEVNIKIEGAHDALTDILILQKLIQHYKISNEQLLKHVISFKSAVQKQMSSCNLRYVLKTLSPLDKVLSQSMLRKLASAGINYERLITEYSTLGADGINKLFTHLIDGKPRITKRDKIINVVISFLKSVT